MPSVLPVHSVEWPSSDRIRAFYTSAFDNTTACNLATHVGNDEARVTNNRRQLERLVCCPNPIVWLQQVHSAQVVDARNLIACTPADGVYSDCVGHVCAVLTADCLPLLLTDSAGIQVMAIHAGWRGLSCDIVAKALAQHWQGDRGQCIAWLGPAISTEYYEVDALVRNAFATEYDGAFIYHRPGHWFCDLKQLATLQLQKMGVSTIIDSGHCTFRDHEFYSYRRQANSGRFASLIWRAS